MPNKPATLCKVCRRTTRNPSGYCDAHLDHEKLARQQFDKQRGTRTQRGYTNKWLSYSKARLKQYPICFTCNQNGIYTQATVTDHIIPVDGPDDPLFWDHNNHQSLCAKCHNEKTARESGFGKTKARRSTPTTRSRLTRCIEPRL